MTSTTSTSARAPRRKGEGTIRQRPSGRWEVRYLDAGNNRASRVMDTEREAVAFLTQTNATRFGGGVVAGTRLTLAAYLDQWMTTHGPGMRPSTAARYEQSIRLWIKPAIGQVRLTELREDHVALMHRTMAGKGLSPNSQRMAHAALGVALNAAVRQRLIPVNVAEHVRRPSAPPRTFRGKALAVPSPDQVALVLTQLAGGPAELPFRLSYATGMRMGEALALRWGDLYVDAAVAGVIITRSRDSKTRSEGPTKTGAGKRSMHLTATMATALREHRDRLAARGIPTDLDAYVFPGDDAGRPMHPSRLRYALEHACDRAGVDRFRWHDIRHSAITARLRAAAQQGLPTLAVSRWAGHSRESVTNDMYGHVEASDLPALAVPGEETL